jgi:Ca2+-binding RTX toxin-like protein
MLGAMSSVVGTGEVSAGGTAERPAPVGSGQASLRTADLGPLGIVSLSLMDVAEADRPTCMGLPASVGGIGTAGDDVITGTSGRDVIVAGPGNDIVYGRNGKDVICGGSGDDKLVGGRNPSDWSQAKHGDRLSGGSGDDRIVDNWGFRDKLMGGTGNDRLRSRGGTEKALLGGPGDDRLVSDHGYDTALLGGRGSDVLTALTGGGISRYHFGGPGRDVIDVGPTGDVVVALTGDGDQLRVHAATSLIPGFWNSPVGVEVDMRSGTARRVGAGPAAPIDVITFLSPKANIWVLYGSPHADRLIGTEGDDVFFAIAGNDTLYGNGGDDGLLGFGGDDFIDGGDGNDSADGGAGTDTCHAEEASKCEL